MAQGRSAWRREEEARGAGLVGAWHSGKVHGTVKTCMASHGESRQGRDNRVERYERQYSE